MYDFFVNQLWPWIQWAIDTFGPIVGLVGGGLACVWVSRSFYISYKEKKNIKTESNIAYADSVENNQVAGDSNNVSRDNIGNTTIIHNHYGSNQTEISNDITATSAKPNSFQDKKQTKEQIMQLAQQGDAEAQFNLGVMYNRGEGVTKDYKKAFECFQKSAEQGHVVAQFNVGVMYDTGRGVEQNYTKAFEWYTKSAEQGHVNAQYNLGVMYGKGEGVDKNYVLAFEWYTKSAEQGHVNAQYNLGVMYNKGEGTMQDYTFAHSWFNIAAASSDEKAKSARDSLAKKMTPEQIAEAQKLAREWKPKK